MNNRFWFQLHSWAGFAFGSLLLLVCLSGTLAVVSYELQYLTDQKFRAIAPREEAVNWSQLEHNLAKEYPDSRIMAVQVHQQTYLAGEVSLYTPQGFLFAYFDPATGTLTGDGEWGTLPRFLRNLHMYLSAGDNGKLLVVSLSWLLVISLISSFFVYRKWWQKWLKMPVKWRRHQRTDWSSWHKFLGIWCWWFVLLITLTSLWYFAEFILLRNNIPHYPTIPTIELTEQHQQQPLSLTALMNIAQKKRPDLDIRAIVYSNKATHPTIISGQSSNILLRNRANRVYVDSISGQVIGTQHDKDLHVIATLVDLADPLHFGNFAGLWLKLLYLLFGSGMTLLVTGGLRMHWLRTQRKYSHPMKWFGFSGGIALVIALAAIIWTGMNFQHRQLGQPPLSPLLAELSVS